MVEVALLHSFSFAAAPSPPQRTVCGSSHLPCAMPSCLSAHVHHRPLRFGCRTLQVSSFVETTQGSHVRLCRCRHSARPLHLWPDFHYTTEGDIRYVASAAFRVHLFPRFAFAASFPNHVAVAAAAVAMHDVMWKMACTVASPTQLRSSPRSSRDARVDAWQGLSDLRSPSRQHHAPKHVASYLLHSLL